MNIAKFSVRNSILINLLSVFIILMGTFTMFQLRREAFPQVEYDIVTITTVWPGAPTEDVEKFVTIPIEKEIKGVSGIEKFTSKSEEGLSEIGVYIDPGVFDKDKVHSDIERAVDRVSNLPDQIEEDPSIFELATREFPVLEISLSGDAPEDVRREYAESLEEEITNLPGVAQIRKYGWLDHEFWVEVDPQKLKEQYVSLQEIMNALRQRNITVPGGELKTTDSEYSIRTTGEFQSAEEIANVIIRANDAGNWLRVKDVATVKRTFEEPSTIAKINGELANAMVVVKTEQADAIEVVASVNALLDEFEKTLPDNISTTVTNDFSYYIKRRLGVLQNNGMIGFVLVLLILFLFLDPVPALMTALGIPIAIFTTFIVMSFFGLTINLVSMLGIIIVLGMLVDDGIIVTENVYRYIEDGMEPRKATILGTTQVVAPITATVLTTFAFFGPMLFLKDIIGKFIREIPLVVIITLSASLLEAFVILPSHLSDVIGYFKKKHTEKHEKKWYVNLRNAYKGTLEACLRLRYVVIAILIGTFIFSLWIGTTQLKFLLFAGEGIETFFVRAEAKKGTPIDKMNELMLPLEELVASLPEDELDSYRTFVGSIEEERGFDPNARRGSHLAQITVFLTPLQQRERTPQEIAQWLKDRFDQVEGFEKVYTVLPREGPPTGKPIEVGVKGEDYATMEKIAAPIIEYLEGRKGVSSVRSNYEFGKKQLNIVVNEEQAQKYFLTISQIAATVRNVFRGGVATTIKPKKAEEEIDVLVRFPANLRNSLDAFDDILVPNQRGNLVRLGAVAEIEEKEGVFRITHKDGKRILYVSAEVDNKDATSREVNLELQDKFSDAAEGYLGYSLSYSGEFEDQQKTLRNMIVSYSFALFLCYIILTAMFKSLLQPLIVMSAIPFGIIGVIISFWLHDLLPGVDRPLNFFALMGLVGLSGIAVNDSVVLVDFINRIRREGHARRDSLIEAGALRLRPVIMTSVTTIGGLISVAYGIGGGDPFLKPMALAIVWGLVFSTALTLIGIPCIYAIVDDFTEKILRRNLLRAEKEIPEINGTA